jgi:effector-binding domain-containing protein
MIEKPQIAQTKEQLAAVIRLKVPRGDMPKVMGPGIGELMAAVQSQGIGPAGSWYSYHYKMEPATFDFEIGVPVKAPVKPVGRVKPGKLPAARVARTVYHGGYEGLGGAWGEFSEWITKNGHKPAENLWEIYAVGPESGPDSSKWRTELNRPLIG